MAAAVSTKPAAAAAEIPKVVNDPRFRAGRRLLTEAHQSEAAIQVFASLLKEAEKAYGTVAGGATIEMAPVFYEYGNALFRHYEATAASLDDDDDEEQQQGADDTSTTTATVKVEGTASSSETPAMQKKRREAAAAAAEKRFQQEKKPSGEVSASPDDGDKKPAAVPSQPKNGDSKGEGPETISTSNKEQKEIGQDAQADKNEAEQDDEGDDDEDIQLSLEMMEEAYSIIEEYLEKSDTGDNAQAGAPPNYRDWAWEQQSRVLTGIADVLSTMGRHADAADAYIRALELRKERLQQVFDSNNDNDDGDKKKMTVDYLRARRLIVESNTLIAHEFLQCDPDSDVVTIETKALIVRAAERVDYARTYYENAREALQETVLLLAQLTAAARVDDGEGLAKEKENVCFASTLVMDVGMQLAQIDDEEKHASESLQQQQPVKKKAKR
jgi:tetratricopeptide (TPR) repeat protein